MIFLDDEFPDHPKTIAAGPDAAMLFVAMLGYANKYLTDGIIPPHHPRLTGRGQKLAERLVVVELCHGSGHDCPHGCPNPKPGGYVIHDYADKNRTALRKAAEARSEKARRAALIRHHGHANGAAVSSEASSAPEDASGMLDACPPGADARPSPQPPPPTSDVGTGLSPSRGGPSSGGDTSRETFAQQVEVARGYPQRRALAGEITDRVMAERRPKPTNRGRVFKLVEGCLEAGWETQPLVTACLSAKALTEPAVEFAYSAAIGTGRPARPEPADEIRAYLREGQTR